MVNTVAFHMRKGMLRNRKPCNAACCETYSGVHFLQQAFPASLIIVMTPLLQRSVICMSAMAVQQSPTALLRLLARPGLSCSRPRWAAARAVLPRYNRRSLQSSSSPPKRIPDFAFAFE